MPAEFISTKNGNGKEIPCGIPKTPEYPSLLGYLRKYEGEVKFAHANISELHNSLVALSTFISGPKPAECDGECAGNREPSSLQSEMDIALDDLTYLNSRINSCISELGEIRRLVGLDIPD